MGVLQAFLISFLSLIYLFQGSLMPNVYLSWMLHSHPPTSHHYENSGNPELYLEYLRRLPIYSLSHPMSWILVTRPQYLHIIYKDQKVN